MTEQADNALIEGKNNKFIVGPQFGNISNYAGTKYPRDLMNICKQQGFRLIRVREGYGKWNVFSMVRDFFRLLKIKPESDVLYIDRVCHTFSRTMVYKICKLKKCALYPILEDVDIIRKPNKNGKREILRLNDAKTIISQNHMMSSFLKKNGVKIHTVNMGVLDFLSKDIDYVKRDNKNKWIICYGGNLSFEQSGFIYSLTPSKNFEYFIYGGKPTVEFNKDRVIYKGAFKDENCIGNLKGDWGLVWNGKSLKVDPNDTFSIYYNYVCPHKFSMYALCSMPVIVYSKSAMAEIVSHYNCGILVDDLNQIEEKLWSITDKQYEEMKKNISKIGMKASCGEFLLDSLKQIGLR